MGVWGLLRRLWADRVTSAALAISVTLALMLLAAGPVYSDAVSVAAMRRSVTDVPTGDATISVEVRTTPAAYVDIDLLATDLILDATAPLDSEVTRSIVSGSTFEVGGGDGTAELIDVAEVAWLESIDRHATIVEGAWPTDGDLDVGPADGGVIEVALDRRAAESFGIAVGDAPELPPRSGDAAPLTVRVVGMYQIDDPTEPFWRGRERFVAGVMVSRLFRTAQLVTTRATMIGGVTRRATASWLSIPRFDRLELAEIDPIRRRVVALEADLEEVRFGVAAGDSDEFEVNTVVPNVLSRSTRALTVARSAVFAVVAQFALLAAYALVLIAGLTVEARSSEIAMLRARGASARQLLGLALTEATVLVVPAALIAPGLAAGLLRGFDEIGPIASIDLRLEPHPVGAAWVVVGLGSIATVALLSWPAYRSARRTERADHRHSRQRLRAGWQRAGIDVALVALAAAAFWQLASLGDDRAASVRGRFGVDPLVVVAPTFGLLAGSLIALRTIPAIGRLAERTAAASTGVVGALAGWQFARRPTRYARAGSLVIMAVAIGTFSAMYEASWTRSQSAQATHQVGADIRISPNRRTGDSITDLQLLAAHERVDGVRRSVPVVRRQVDVPGSERPGLLLALDAERASVDDPALTAALTELAARRPETAGVPIPDDAASLEVTARLEMSDDPDAPQPAAVTPLRGDLILTVRDGVGLLNRIHLGAVDEGNDATTLVRDLAVQWPDGSRVLPMSPLTIVDIEFRVPPTQGPSRWLELEIEAMRASTPRGFESVEIAGSAWRASTTRFQFMFEPPSFALIESTPERGLLTSLVTGSTDNSGLVLFNLRAPGNQPPRALPVVVAGTWLIDAGFDIGDIVPVELIRADATRVEIVAAVDSVPTVDPSREDALVVDLSTLQLLEFDSGRSIADVVEHWLEVDDVDPDLLVIEATLGDAPIEATASMVSERRRAELTSNPPALGAIGALTLGFIAASAFALVGFALTTVVSAHERRLEFALLRSLGLSIRQLRRWMLLEQLALVAMAVVFGAAVGVALGLLVLPLVSLTQTGTAVYPPIEVIIPWRTIAGLQSALIVGLLSSVVAVTAAARRIATSALLRAGGDT